uniref:Glutamyl aminopeptidase n=1 Tax=Aceria tosichella TaxID=561515 RepID=A0A6G1SGE8_9ACAR
MRCTMSHSMAVRLIYWVIILFAGCLGDQSAEDAAEFQSFDDDTQIEVPFHRLPTHVKPVKYTIDLDFVSPITETRDRDESWHYAGMVTIDVEFTSLTTSIKDTILSCFDSECREKKAFSQKRIIMHADNMVKITDVQVVTKNGDSSVVPLRIVSSGRDSGKQMIVLQMESDLPSGGEMGQIIMKFRAPILRDMHGVYLSETEVEHGQNTPVVYHHIVAKFQPTFARLALPCFDEPSFKARFKLAIKHDKSIGDHPMQAHANMPSELIRQEETHTETIFHESPPMSMHMVAFVLGPFDTTLPEKTTKSGMTLRFLGVPDMQFDGEWAVSVATNVVNVFEKYIDYTLPLKKLDVVVIDELDTDNLESWGLVFLRRHNSPLAGYDLLMDGKPSIGVNLVHTVVHQWFGNLVTAAWWDDFWLIESVSAQAAIDFMQSYHPLLYTEYFVRAGLLSDTLSLDKTGRMHPLSPTKEKLSTSAGIEELFDRLTFMKSASVGEMMVNSLGSDSYKTALQCIVKRFANKSIEFDDYIKCIRTAANEGQNLKGIEKMLHSFSKQSGYPVVNVALKYPEKSHGNSLFVYVEPFYDADSKATEQHSSLSAGKFSWCLPLMVLVANRGEDDFVKQPIKCRADGSFEEIKLPKWFDIHTSFVLVQPEPDISSYYRIRYSDELYEKLMNAILERHIKIMPKARIQIIDDTVALRQSHLVSEYQRSNMFEAFHKDRDYGVKLKLLFGAQSLRETNGDVVPRWLSSSLYDYFLQPDNYYSRQTPALNHEALSRALKELVISGDKSITSMAIDASRRFLDTRGAGHGFSFLFLAEPIYAAVVKYGDKAQIDKLLQQLKKTKYHQDKIHLAEALALSENKQVLEKLVKIMNIPKYSKKIDKEKVITPRSKLTIENGRVALKAND